MDPTAEELIARLRRNPDDHTAFAMLRGVYEQRRDYPSLVNLLEGWAARAADPVASADTFVEAADLAQGVLGDGGRSLALYEKALARVPTHVHACSRAEGLLEAQVGAAKRVEWLERYADMLGGRDDVDPRTRAMVHQRLGDAWATSLARPDRALLHYRQAYEIDPTMVGAIYEAREIYRRGGNHRAAALLFDLEVAAEPSPSRKVALLREAAHFKSENLADYEGAVTALERAMSIAPSAEIHYELAAVLLRRAETTEDPARSAADRGVARDLLVGLAERAAPDAALTYLEMVLDVAPNDADALALFEEAAERCGRTELLAVRWVAFLQAAPDAPAAWEVRRRLGHAYVAAEQVEDAIFCFEPLAQEGDVEAAAVLCDLYRRAERYADLARVLGLGISQLPPTQQVGRLRDALKLLVRHALLDEARDVGRTLLELDPGDPDAVTFLEDDARQRDDFAGLCEVLAIAARAPGLPVEARKQRHREIAALAETKLDDDGAAIDAWRAVFAVDPTDADARTNLRRLLEKSERWDDLARLLERDALTTLDARAKAVILRDLADVHRSKRGAPIEARKALDEVARLTPEDRTSRLDLGELRIETGDPGAAIAGLKELLATSDDVEEKRKIRGLLAGALEVTNELEEAFSLCAAALEDSPKDEAAIDRMERIDNKTGRVDRLLGTLSYRADLAPTPQARTEIFVHMAELADEKLHDLDRVVELYARALDGDPANQTVLDKLCHAYDRAERYKDLVMLLRTRAERAQSASERAELYRRIARTLRDRVRNDEAAVETWRQVLACGEDEEALRQLVTAADRADDHEAHADLLRRLAEVVADDEERRDLLVTCADVLAHHLDRKMQALETLERITERLDPQFAPAMSRAADLAEDLGEKVRFGAMLFRLLPHTAGVERLTVAKRLSDLATTDPVPPEAAIEANRAWIGEEPNALDPRRRLVHALETADLPEQLVVAIDALAEREAEGTRVTELVLQAAAIAEVSLGDVAGATGRLLKRADRGDARANEALFFLAKKTSGGEGLAQQYIVRAQKAASGADERSMWLAAARVYEEVVGDVTRALETTLRAFATATNDMKLLDEVERLTTKAAANARLAQVYDSLLRRTEANDDKLKLLRRHAAWLAGDGKDPEGALDRLLRACSLAPSDQELIDQAAKLAKAAGRSDEMLIVYDRQRREAPDPAGRVAAALRATLTCLLEVGDVARGTPYLRQAIASAEEDALLEKVDATVRALEVPSETVVVRWLAKGYVAVAGEVKAPSAKARFVKRAAALLTDVARDVDAAFAVLEEAAQSTMPDETLVDELERLAEAHDRNDALEALYARIADEAVDSKTATLAHRRRGALLEKLGRHSDAADVYSLLLGIAPNDAHAPDRLRETLTRAGRHKDLLVAIDRQLERISDAGRRLELLRESARIWEHEIHNRWEALDVWKRVGMLVPDDVAAKEAIARLTPRRGSSRDVDDLLEDAPPTPSTKPVPSERPSASSKANETKHAEVDALLAEVANEPIVPSPDAPTSDDEAVAPPPPAHRTDISVEIEVGAVTSARDEADDTLPPVDPSRSRRARGSREDTRELEGPELAAASAEPSDLNDLDFEEDGAEPPEKRPTSEPPKLGPLPTVESLDTGFEDEGTLDEFETSAGYIRSRIAADHQARAATAASPEGYQDASELVEDVTEPPTPVDTQPGLRAPATRSDIPPVDSDPDPTPIVTSDAVARIAPPTQDGPSVPARPRTDPSKLHADLDAHAEEDEDATRHDILTEPGAVPKSSSLPPKPA